MRGVSAATSENIILAACQAIDNLDKATVINQLPLKFAKKLFICFHDGFCHVYMAAGLQ